MAAYCKRNLSYISSSMSINSTVVQGWQSLNFGMLSSPKSRSCKKPVFLPYHPRPPRNLDAIGRSSIDFCQTIIIYLSYAYFSRKLNFVLTVFPSVKMVSCKGFKELLVCIWHARQYFIRGESSSNTRMINVDVITMTGSYKRLAVNGAKHLHHLSSGWNKNNSKNTINTKYLSNYVHIVMIESTSSLHIS